MKTLNLNIDYQRPQESIDKISNSALTCDYLDNVIVTKYPELQGQKLRAFARIQRKLDAALEGKLETIDFEDGDFDLIKEAFKDLRFNARLAKYVVYLMDEIDKL